MYSAIVKSVNTTVTALQDIVFKRKRDSYGAKCQGDSDKSHSFGDKYIYNSDHCPSDGS